MLLRAFRAALPVIALASITSAAGLQDTIRGLVGSMGPKKGITSISIRDSDGTEVVQIAGDSLVMPASNQKLLTTGAALRQLGPGFVFQTKLLRHGDTLTVVGDGDPALGDPDMLEHMTYTDAQGVQHTGMTVEALLGLWTGAVKAAGITSVKELVIDDRVFEQGTCHADWPVDQLNEAYCAEVAGLNFHLNRLDFWAIPSARGATVTRTEPACSFVTIANNTSPGKSKNDGLWIHREPDSNAFTVRGFLRKPLVAPISVSVSDPAMFFGNLLAERLRTVGVSVHHVRRESAGAPVATGALTGPVFRTTLQAAITRCNVDSQNLYAESLLKRLGHAASGAPGSWENGTDAMERLVSARVGGAAGLDAADGSGLSRDNRLTTTLMTAWINDLLRDSAVCDPFLSSLAVGGQNGTVRKRFGDLDGKLATVRCKTGYIDGVSALSGVVDCTNGHRIAFSVISNGFEGGGVAKARQLQDAVVKAIARNFGKLPSRVVAPERPALGGG